MDRMHFLSSLTDQHVNVKKTEILRTLEIYFRKLYFKNLYDFLI